MSSRQFLFVNKDADSSSLTRGSSKEQSSINSHVQRGRRHRRSVHSSSRRKVVVDKDEHSPVTERVGESSPTGSTSSSSSVPIRAPGFTTFVLNPDGGHKVSSPHQSQPPQLQTEETSDSINPETVQTAEQTSEDLLSFARPESESAGSDPLQNASSYESPPQDISQVAINSLDPFSMASVTIDPEVHQLMQYYQVVYHPAVWHAETRASGKSTYAFQTSAVEVLRDAMQSSVDMYALLACMASRMQHVDQRPGQSVDQYLQKALSSTRQLIQQRIQTEVKTNEQILMIIFHLYAAEGYRDNIKAAKIHLRAAKTIVDCIGGLSKLRDPQMRELLIIGDGHLSAIMLEPCEFPCDFDPGPYHDATPLDIQITRFYDFATIAPALRQQLRTDLIPEAIHVLIEETAECVWVLQNAKDAAPEPSKHAMRWVGMRNLAIRHRLQALQLNDGRVDAVRVALMLWILITMTLLGLKRLSLVIAPKLRVILKLASKRNLEWGNHVDLKAWILSLGAMCAAVGSTDEGWFVRKLAQIVSQNAAMPGGVGARPDDSYTFERLLGFQHRFFYHDPVQRPRLTRLTALLAGIPSHLQSAASG